MNTIIELARHMSVHDQQALAQLLARAIHEVAPRATVVHLVHGRDITELCWMLDDIAPQQLQIFMWLV